MFATKLIADQRSHRPWPLPTWPWIMFQSWRDLLFAHWPLPAAVLRPLVPPTLELDEHDGSAWLGLTPFRVVGSRPRYLPPCPGVSSFLEMNLRTYVRAGDTSGVFFFSLDTNSRLSVLGARSLYGLPYHTASMSLHRRGRAFHYRSSRDGEAELDIAYQPTGPVFRARLGSLEHFLTERYALYAVRRGKLVIAEIHHEPWRLQMAQARIFINSVVSAQRILLPVQEPLLHFAARQDTIIWPPRLYSPLTPPPVRAMEL